MIQRAENGAWPAARTESRLAVIALVGLAVVATAIRRVGDKSPEDPGLKRFLSFQTCSPISSGHDHPGRREKSSHGRGLFPTTSAHGTRRHGMLSFRPVPPLSALLTAQSPSAKAFPVK